MPRRAPLTLTSAGLAMPAVSEMFNKNMLNVVLDRTLTGSSPVPSASPLMGLWMNFVRLTDKALREYDASRHELLSYVGHAGGFRTSPYIRAIDHMENCLSAAHRAVLDAAALRAEGLGTKAVPITERQEQRLRLVRNTIEHTDERLVGPNPRWPSAVVFTREQPFALRLANRGMVIGADDLAYAELVAVLRKMYRAVEAIRGASVRPADTWTNAMLRTDAGTPASGSSMRPSDFLRDLGRLVITHG